MGSSREPIISQDSWLSTTVRARSSGAWELAGRRRHRQARAFAGSPRPFDARRVDRDDSPAGVRAFLDLKRVPRRAAAPEIGGDVHRRSVEPGQRYHRIHTWIVGLPESLDGLEGSSAIGFDATRKQPGDARNNEPVRAWPPPIEMSEATKARVTRRWEEYGF